MNIFSLHSYAFRVALGAAVIYAAEVSAGTLTVKFGSAMEVEIDGEIQSFAKNATFSPAAIPCIYKMRPAGLTDGQRTFAIAGTDQIRSQNIYRFPQYGDGNWVRVALDPYPAEDTTVTLTGYKATGIFYADAEHGNDEWDGTAAVHEEGTIHGPKKTLQEAHDDSTGSYPVVLVAPGFYSNGVAIASNTSKGVTYTSKRRLFSTKNIGFVATEGPEKTFIVGAPDPDTGGNGDGAIGGVYMQTTALPAYIQGFTITGCYSPASQSGLAQFGSAFCSGSYRLYSLDCIISNNYATAQYPATCYGVHQRDRIFENKSGQYTTYYGAFIACVFAGNRITNDNGTWVSSAIHNQAHTHFCTYDLRNADNPDGRKRVDGPSTYLRGALVYGLTDRTTISESPWGNSQAFDNPVFGDADARDYRLGVLSPAIDALSYESDLNGTSRSVMASDVDGRIPVLHNGKMRLGAVWNDPALPVMVIDTRDSGMSVSGIGTGTNAITSAHEITVTATDFSKRPFVGFDINGEILTSTDGTYTFTPSVVDGAVTSIKAIYTNVWYVAQNGGDDANNGGWPNQAKATIRAATAKAVSGDIIRVAPGTYGEAEGARKYLDKANSLCRVIIPDGVTLESTHGAEDTFIVGAASNDETANAHGNGPGAVRCVYANNGSVLRGFTLTGGHTEKIGTGETSSYDYYGAAVLTVNTGRSAMEECIVSNNYSHYATLFRVNVKRCRIIGNIGGTGTGTTTDCAAGSSCAYIGCIIDGNRGNGTIGYSSRVESCTIGTNTMHDERSAQVLYTTSANGHRCVINSVFLYGSDRWYGTVYATNCIFAAEVNTSTLKAENCGNCKFDQSAAKIGIGADYRLLPGSVAIDAGDNSFVSGEIEGAKDIHGTPRVLNAKIDIGAVEYDWRPAFADRIGRRLVLTDVSPTVTTNAAGGLIIPSGAVAGTVSSKGFYDFTFDVSGGTLEVTFGGEVVGTYPAGAHTVRVRALDPAKEFRFAFLADAENPGAAIIKSVYMLKGMVLSIR